MMQGVTLTTRQSYCDKEEKQTTFNFWPSYDPNNKDIFKAAVKGLDFYNACQTITLPGPISASEKENSPQRRVKVRIGQKCLTMARSTNDEVFLWMVDTQLAKLRDSDEECLFEIDACILRRIGVAFKDDNFHLAYDSVNRSLELCISNSKMKVCVSVSARIDDKVFKPEKNLDQRHKDYVLSKNNIIQGIDIVRISRSRRKDEKYYTEFGPVVKNNSFALRNQRSITVYQNEDISCDELAFSSKYLKLMKHCIGRMNGDVNVSIKDRIVHVNSSKYYCAWPQKEVWATDLLISKAKGPMIPLASFNSDQLYNTLLLISLVSDEFSICIETDKLKTSLIFEAREGRNKCISRHNLGFEVSGSADSINLDRDIIFRVTEMLDFVKLAGNCKIELSACNEMIRLSACNLPHSMLTVFIGQSVGQKLYNERYQSN